MRRLMSAVLLSAALLGGTLSLTGCIIVPAHRARVWVPGYWAPQHVWVGAHWRYR